MKNLSFKTNIWITNNSFIFVYKTNVIWTTKIWQLIWQEYKNTQFIIVDLTQEEKKQIENKMYLYNIEIRSLTTKWLFK